MLRDIFLFFSGRFRVRIPHEYVSLAVEYIVENGVLTYGGINEENGDYSFFVSPLQLNTIKKFSLLHNAQCTVSDIQGFPKLFYHLVKHPGFIIGLAVFFCVVSYCSDIIWKIDVIGNKSVSDASVIALLDELGCGYGTRISSVDFDQLRTQYLARSEDISWISVNMKGTHAFVEVREKRLGKQDTHEEGVYANLVSTEDARIISTEVRSGLSTVSIGDVVRKGEVLVSGVVPVKGGRVRYEYAEGEVNAYVSKVIEAEIPFVNTKKVYTGRSFCKKNAIFFKKSINLSINSGIEYTTYDKIVENEQVCIFGTPIPMWIEKTTFREYTYVDVEYGEDELVSEALISLRHQLEEVMVDSELVSSKFTHTLTADSYKIKCELLCITDIASIAEFTVKKPVLPDYGIGNIEQQ